MNICIPIEAENGLDSAVCAHFGSAPAYLIVDVEKLSFRTVVNQNQHHSHGMCMPLQSLRGEAIDGMVVGGIGMGAFNKLQAANIQVYIAEHATVGEVVDAFRAGRMTPMQPGMTCSAHHHG